jgi:hypothetical protein
MTSKLSSFRGQSVQVKQVHAGVHVLLATFIHPLFLSAHYRNAHFGQVNLDTPRCLNTLTEVFENGLAISRDLKYLGHRPKLSTNPDKFAPYYVWETYAQIDVRRRAVGSALTKLFDSGEIGGGEFKTVGTWSPNRPGVCVSSSFLPFESLEYDFAQSGKLSNLLSKLMVSSESVCMILSARTQLVRAFLFVWS